MINKKSLVGPIKNQKMFDIWPKNEFFRDSAKSIQKPDFLDRIRPRPLTILIYRCRVDRIRPWPLTIPIYRCRVDRIRPKPLTILIYRCRVDRIRPWPLTIRNNQTMRPTLAEMDDGERSMTEVKIPLL